ncbi:LysR family transcriptional regulator [Neorhizobium sp. P12A]|nr:LysR family transcriptional regulator [Neorhizobium sp. P12A]
MNPRLLKTFQSVARHRNITRCAAELHLSQSAVSDQVQALEADLGAKLFLRSRGGLELTPAGEVLITYAEEILSLSQEARAAVASVAGSAGRGLTIGALETIARSKLPEWLTFFRGRHSDVAIRLKVAGSGDLIQQLDTGGIDVAFCFDQGRVDSRLATRLVVKEPLVLITPVAGRSALQNPTLAELGSASFVATEVGCVYRALFERAFVDAGISSPKPAIEAGSIEAIAKLVGTGAGISLAPRLAVADALRRGELSEMPWPGAAQTASLVMVWRRRRVLPPALKLLLSAPADMFGR